MSRPSPEKDSLPGRVVDKKLHIHFFEKITFLTPLYFGLFQVTQAFDKFVAEHPNGKMKKAYFREMMDQVFHCFMSFILVFVKSNTSFHFILFQALPKQDAGKMANHVFRIYDKNNDGVIDFVEFMVSSQDYV